MSSCKHAASNPCRCHTQLCTLSTPLARPPGAACSAAALAALLGAAASSSSLLLPSSDTSPPLESSLLSSPLLLPALPPACGVAACREPVAPDRACPGRPALAAALAFAGAAVCTPSGAGIGGILEATIPAEAPDQHAASRGLSGPTAPQVFAGTAVCLSIEVVVGGILEAGVPAEAQCLLNLEYVPSLAALHSAANQGTAMGA